MPVVATTVDGGAVLVQVGFCPLLRRQVHWVPQAVLVVVDVAVIMQRQVVSRTVFVLRFSSSPDFADIPVRSRDGSVGYGGDEGAFPHLSRS